MDPPFLATQGAIDLREVCMKPTAEDYVQLLLAQEGDEYEWGVKPDPNDPDPVEGDCSGYVAWGANRLKVVPKMPHGSVNQRDHCYRNGGKITIQEGVEIRGALLFRIGKSNHVATSLGDGRTIEAKGEDFGVVIDTANPKKRKWTHAALIPGLEYPDNESRKERQDELA